MGHSMPSIGYLGLLLVLLVSCTSMHHRNLTHLRVVPVAELLAEPAQLAAIGQEMQDGQEVVFHFRAGQTIPLNASMALPMVTLQPGKNMLVFTRDTYVFLARSTVEISLDGQRWVDIQDWQSLKALLGFDKGALSLGLRGSHDEGTHMAIDLSAQ